MSFPRYPKYKASGVEWLGEVPEGWEVSRIKWLGKTVTGGTPKTEEPAYWIDGDVPWLPSGKVQNNTINQEDADTFITKKALAESAAKLIRPGSALIALTGATCANAAYLTFESTANQSVVGIEPQFNSNGRFLYFSLLSQREQVLTHKSGGAQGGINQEDVRNLVITAPPLPEQTAIAEFLDRETGKIDELVAEQRRLMELLKEKRQAVISHAVTKGLNPHAPMKPSGIEWLGDVPDHWGVKKIRHFAEVLRGKFTHRPRNDPRFYGGEFPFIQTGDITASSRFITEFKQTLNELGVSVSKEFPKGTLVMAIAANIGDVAILEFPAYFPDSIVGLVPKRNFDLYFLYFLMIAMKQPMLMTATVSTQMNLNVDQISSLTAGAPPLEEQKAIVEFLDTELAKFDTLTAEAQRAIDLLQERRTALISAAVTGQIDVRTT